MQTGYTLFIHFMCGSACVILVLSITVTLCIAFQGAMSFSPTGKRLEHSKLVLGPLEIFSNLELDPRRSHYLLVIHRNNSIGLSGK
jgi:hypothetical protein